MNNLYFGELLRIRREELNISQDDLCKDICERSTLSKIERGKNECSRHLAELFLQKLGLPMEFYYASSTKNEIAQLKVKSEIKEAIRMREYEKLPELIDEGMNYIDDVKTFHQFILRSKATYLLRVKNDVDKSRKLLMDAVLMAHPLFDIHKMDKTPIFNEDIYIINMLANIYAEENKHKEAIEIFKNLLSVLKSNRNKKDIDNIRRIIMVEYNLSRSLGCSDRYVECLELSEEAIELSIRTGTMTYLGELFMNKAYSLCSMHTRKEEGIPALREALTFNRMTGHSENVDIIKEDSKRLFNIDLSEF